jgi:hypothetical protein
MFLRINVRRLVAVRNHEVERCGRDHPRGILQRGCEAERARLIREVALGIIDAAVADGIDKVRALAVFVKLIDALFRHVGGGG